MPATSGAFSLTLLPSPTSTLRIMADEPDTPTRGLITPPAVQINAGRIVKFGTALYFLAFAALLPWYGWLGRHHHRVWLWTCLAGWILGLIGYAIIGRHRTTGRTI
jgi:hypothetical protein